ncbi:glycosyltransferase family 9 protein [Advenella mimigardefordensis]|uniref:Putative ADP-heptose--LPS heptosyltransferase 2 n=1 Tax=Advenella mimigardefordensis (strain DSM 17166 / LMG 22922 / DPN7) TaxID=1247726 RepID=W0P9T2_ADVMD|nr:glycosyltransferase family 9 protein [Advenella mimigardefordensis]AHG63614.1 putative ADP-heptose--LPS heptosyltransferase 2 [Advenella mimigardefordensis DPN7]
MKNLERVYIRLPNWIGDVCMSRPAIEAALASGLTIVACGKPWAQALMGELPGLQFLALSGQWRQDRQRIKAHRSEHPCAGRSVGLLLPDSLTSALAFRLAGLPCAGYRDDGRSLLLRWGFTKPAQTLHAVQSWYWLTREAFARWDVTLPAEPANSLSLPSGTNAIAAAQAALAAAGVTNAPILIAPTATGEHKGKNKVWPYFDKLTRQLQAQGYTVVMSPPPNEVAQAQANAPTATLLAALDLTAFVALLRQCSLVICNDSGVAHLAALTETPQLTLIGVTNPTRTRPWTPRAHLLGTYGQWPSVADVLNTVNQLLRNE